MILHFTIGEFAERRQQAIALMAERNIDGLLMFRQESMYYLTGYDTFGYVFFQWPAPVLMRVKFWLQCRERSLQVAGIIPEMNLSSVRVMTHSFAVTGQSAASWMPWINLLLNGQGYIATTMRQ